MVGYDRFYYREFFFGKFVDVVRNEIGNYLVNVIRL